MSDHVVRAPLPAGVAHRAAMLSTITSSTLAPISQAQRGTDRIQSPTLVGCGAWAASAAGSISVSQSGSTSTKVPKLAYQPQRRQMLTTPDARGSSHFSQHGPVHSATAGVVLSLGSSKADPFVVLLSNSEPSSMSVAFDMCLGRIAVLNRNPHQA